MTDKQEKLYVLIKEIDQLCKKHGLRYYMAGGSLIGVLRHRGYIPWDDDMDILMPRDDFNKFIEICKNELPKERVLETQETDRNYHNTLARYIDKTSTAFHSTQLSHDDPAGFVIDILVLDPIPDDKKIMQQYKNDILLYSDIINGTLVYSYRFGINAWRFIKAYIQMLFIGKDKVLKKIEDRLFCYKESECSKYVMRWSGCIFFFDKQMYGDGKFAPFLDFDAMIPEQSVEYLTWHYGDEWMYIPPHSEQEGHSAVYSLDTEYQEIKDVFKTLVDTKKLSKQYYHRKIFCFIMMNRRLKRKEKRFNFNLTLKGQNVLNYLNNNKDIIEQAYANDDITTLKDYFDEYLSLQLARNTIGREDYIGISRFEKPFLIDAPSLYIEMALRVLFCTNRISKAARLIEIAELKGKATDLMLEIKQDILTFRQAISCYSNKEFDKTEQICDALLSKYPKCISLLKLKIRLLIIKNDNYEFNNEIEKLIAESFKLFPTDGDLLKHQADITDSVDKKIEMYLTAVNFTDNGVVHLEIKDFIEQYKSKTIEFLSYLVKTKKENAITLVNNYLFLFENDQTVLVLRNILVESLYEYPTGLIVAEKAMRKLINQYESDIFTSRYNNLIYKITSNQEISKLFYQIFTNDLDNKKLQFCLDSIESENYPVEWANFAKCIINTKLGNTDEVFKLYLNIALSTNNEILKHYCSLFFYSDISTTAKQIEFFNKMNIKMPKSSFIDKFNKNKVEQYKNKIINSNLNKVFDKLNQLYPSYIETLNMLERLDMLSQKQVNFILATLADENKNTFNYMSVLTLNIMLKVNKMEKSDSFEQYEIESMYENIDRINHPENYNTIEYNSPIPLSYLDDKNIDKHIENSIMDKQLIDIIDNKNESDDIGKGDEINE